MISDGTRWKGLKASNYRAARLREVGWVATEYDLLLTGVKTHRPMKSLPALIAICLFVSLAPAPAAEPAKEAEREQQQVLAMTKEVQAQQAAIADNQAKIDAKTVTIAEALRLAKIYASRGGH
jgi:hypothetical protein